MVVVGLVLLLQATPTSAVSWQRPAPISGPGYSGAHDLVALGEDTLVVLYSDFGFLATRYFLKRSTDGGSTWSRRTEVPFQAIAGNGRFVDAVWINDDRVRYARSSDHGRTFAPPRTLSPADARATDVHVARGADGQVLIVWKMRRGPIVSRTSSDGGLSFGATQPVTRNTSASIAIEDIAVAEGASYVAYVLEFQRVRLRTSVDEGRSWGGSIRVSEDYWDVSLVAQGERAYVGFSEFREPGSSARFSGVEYIATTDTGSTWSDPRDLSPDSWDSFLVELHLRGGVLSAVFDRCTPGTDTCDDSRVFYRETVDGAKWSAPERVSPTNLVEAYPAGVATVVDRASVMYVGCADDCAVFVRSGAR